MATTAHRSHQVFEPNARYTPEEVAEEFKVTLGQVRRWMREGRFPEGGVIQLPQERRIFGWALNQFIAERTL